LSDLPSIIAYLDEVFPDKCPSPDQTDRQIWMDVGSRRVVDHLKMKLEEIIESDRVISGKIIVKE